MPKLGRPKKSDIYGGHIRRVENVIADHLPEFVDNLMRIAKGVFIEVELKDGTKRIYQEAPCRQSNEYLLNRIMGKPTERIITTPEDLPDPSGVDQDGNEVEP